MLTVSQLYVHPVKSLAGFQLSQVKLTGKGPEYDRRWMVVNGTGKFVTQRQYPKMCLIGTSIDDGVLSLSDPSGDLCRVRPAQGGIRQVQVWHDLVAAHDCGDEVAHWLSNFLGVSVRLVYMPERSTRLVDQEYALNNEAVSFADGFPLLLVSQSSLDLLNQKLDLTVSMERFRPNVVISGCEAHAEDDWQKVEIAGNTLSLPKPCSRCVIPSIDPLTGLKQDQVIKVLSGYRRRAGKIYFGQNALIEQTTEQRESILSVGDSVTVLKC